jgi:hypothetical protein
VDKGERADIGKAERNQLALILPQIAEACRRLSAAATHGGER